MESAFDTVTQLMRKHGLRVWTRKSDRAVGSAIRGRLGNVPAEMRHQEGKETFPKLSPYMRLALAIPEPVDYELNGVPK